MNCIFDLNRICAVIYELRWVSVKNTYEKHRLLAPSAKSSLRGLDSDVSEVQSQNPRERFPWLIGCNAIRFYYGGSLCECESDMSRPLASNCRPVACCKC